MYIINVRNYYQFRISDVLNVYMYLVRNYMSLLLQEMYVLNTSVYAGRYFS